MKMLLLSVMAFLAFNYANSQSVDKKKVPAGVSKAFVEKYPGEDKPGWRKDRNGNFESHFKKDGTTYRADFTPAGNWIETERSIKKDDLPRAIRKQLKKHYDDYKIVEIEEVDHPAKGLFYDVELKKDREKMDVEFTENGEIIN